MKKFPFLSLLAISLVLLLSACASSAVADPIPSTGNPTAPSSPVFATLTPENKSPSPDLSRTDSQGAVTVKVTPLDLNPDGETLVFEVSMNTHSVNLGMDLAKLATLTTDTGKTIQAVKWDGPAGGGYHVSGKLTFPNIVEEKPLLLGAKQVTLTIKDVDAASRTFTWPIN